MTAQAQMKYGIPVSGRVDVLLHKKLKSEAVQYGLTMSKMVDTALSEWAQTSEIREADQQLRIELSEVTQKLQIAEKTIVDLKAKFSEENKGINQKWKEAVGKFIIEISKNDSKTSEYYQEVFIQQFENA